MTERGLLRRPWVLRSIAIVLLFVAYRSCNRAVGLYADETWLLVLGKAVLIGLCASAFFGVGELIFGRMFWRGGR